MKLPIGSRLALAAGFVGMVDMVDAGRKKVTYVYSVDGKKPEVGITLAHKLNDRRGTEATYHIDSGSFRNLVLPLEYARDEFPDVKERQPESPTNHALNVESLNGATKHWRVMIDEPDRAPRGARENRINDNWVAFKQKPGSVDYRKPSAAPHGLLGLPAMRKLNMQIAFQAKKIVNLKQKPVKERPVVLVRPPKADAKKGVDVDKIFLNARIGEEGSVHMREFCMVLDTGGPASSLPDFAVEGQPTKQLGKPMTKNGKKVVQVVKKGHGQADAVENRPLLSTHVELRLKTADGQNRSKYQPKSIANGGLYPLYVGKGKRTKFDGGVVDDATGRRGNFTVRKSNCKDRKKKTPPPRYWGILGMPFISEEQPHFLYLRNEDHVDLSPKQLSVEYHDDLAALGFDSRWLQKPGKADTITFYRTVTKPGCMSLYQQILKELPNRADWVNPKAEAQKKLAARQARRRLRRNP